MSRFADFFSNKGITHDATNITPVDGAHGVSTTPVLTGSTFYPLFGVPQTLRRFQVIGAGGDFSVPLYEGTQPSSGGVAALSHTVATALAINAGFAWRYRDETVVGEVGAWSAPTTFTTASIYVASPTVTSPASGAVNVGAQPVITLSAFTVSGGTDTQLSASVRIMDPTGAIVWQLLDSISPLNNFTVPAGILLPGNTTYTIQARQAGNTYGESTWSAATSFTTETTFNLNGVWTQRSGGATARSGHAAAAVGGVMYVHGGGSSGLADLWAYTQLTDSWAQLASAPTARAGHAMVAYNGNLYVVGGNTSEGITASLSMYNPTTNTWSALTGMPAPLAEHSAVVIGSKMYVYGGATTGSSAATNDFYAYDFVAGTWSTLVGNPAVIYHAAGAVNGIMYICGGAGASFSDSNQLWSYNPSTAAWTPLTPITYGRRAARGIGIGSGFYVYGGYNSYSNTYFKDLEFYDTTTNTWSALASGPYTLNSYSVAEVNGAAYYFGGIKGSYNSTDPYELENKLYSVN